MAIGVAMLVLAGCGSSTTTHSATEGAAGRDRT